MITTFPYYYIIELNNRRKPDLVGMNHFIPSYSNRNQELTALRSGLADH